MLRSRRVPFVATLCLAASGMFVGCQSLLGIEDYVGSGGASASSSGGAATGGTGMGGTVDVGPGATVTSTSVGGAGGAGGAGGGRVVLSDDGLIVRYYLDEGSSGTPGPAIDSANMALDLYPTEGGTPTTPPMTYGQVPAGLKGVRWPANESNGRFLSPNFDNKIRTRLNAADTTATIEVVAAVASSSDNMSRFLGWSPNGNNDSDFSFGPVGGPANNQTVALEFRSNDDLGFSWLYALDTKLRVLHLVINRDAVSPLDWHVLYVDGVSQGAPSGMVGDTFNQDLSLDSGSHRFSLGNRTDGQRSIEGFLGYVAIYDIAMDPGLVKTHAEFLSTSHDTP